jgi:hypothetical protein
MPRIIACGMPEHVIALGERDLQRSFTQKQPYVIDKSMEQFRQFILSISMGRMIKTKNSSPISPIKSEIRTWYAFEGPLGDVIHNKRFFFAWQEGCLMGTYNTLEEATASLPSRETRETHC